jgi:hypothetical protein
MAGEDRIAKLNLQRAVVGHPDLLKNVDPQVPFAGTLADRRVLLPPS